MAHPATGAGELGGHAGPLPRAGGAGRTAVLAAIAIVVLGFVLRLAGTRGDLWLDEIWTLELVRPLTAWWQVFTEIPHDNNHWLNSAWVMLAGPDAPVQVLRSASVLMGTASVAAAGLAVRGRAARLAAMALVAMSPALVNYGSEARGYSGLVLATLLAVALTRRELERPTRGGPLLLGLAAAVGLFSHAFMLETLAVLLAWALALGLAKDGFLRACSSTARLFWPAGLAAAAWAICLAWSVSRHGYAFGGMFVSTPGSFVAGWAESLRMVFGLPEAWPSWACLAGAAALLGAAIAGSRRDPFLFLCAGAFLAIPALLYVLAIPNTVFGRYFLVPALFLLLALAQAFGHWMAAGGAARAIGGAVLAGLLALQLTGLAGFVAQGRGAYSAAVATMAGDGGDISYGSDRAARAQRIVSYYAGRQGLSSRMVPEEDWCADPPRWMIRDSREAPDGFAVCGQAPHQYRLAARWPSWRYSGAPWSLYRRDGPGLRPGL